MTDEELRRLAVKELLAYVKDEASAMCPASQNYWKEHLEKTLNRIDELESIITNHEFYQNGYKVAEKDCRVKFGKELYEKDNAIEIRDFRIKELEKENAKLKSIANFQTSSNMDRYFQLKRSKEQLTKAKEMIQEIVTNKAVIKVYNPYADDGTVKSLEIALNHWLQRAEQFLSEV